MRSHSQRPRDASTRPTGSHTPASKAPPQDVLTLRRENNFHRIPRAVLSCARRDYPPLDSGEPSTSPCSMGTRFSLLNVAARRSPWRWGPMGSLNRQPVPRLPRCAREALASTCRSWRRLSKLCIQRFFYEELLVLHHVFNRHVMILIPTSAKCGSGKHPNWRCILPGLQSTASGRRRLRLGAYTRPHFSST